MKNKQKKMLRYVAHFLTISGFTDSDDLAHRLQWLPE